jgi:hypothetical protein
MFCVFSQIYVHEEIKSKLNKGNAFDSKMRPKQIEG